MNQNTNHRLLSTSEKSRILLDFFWDALNPPEYLDLDEWADKYRKLPSETSSEHGDWSTDRFPFLRKIMKCLSPSMPACKFVSVMKGHQIGFTEIAINWILYIADMFPCPMMYTQAGDDAVKEFSKQRLKPSIDACEKLYYKLGAGKSGDLPDSMTYKAYPGGYLTMGPGNSETYTRSKPVAYAGVDEEDSYVLSSGSGGSPIKKIANRMSNFPDSKLYRCSTPKIKETSTILQAYEGGTEEQFYVPCPYCNPSGHDAGFMFVIKWEHIQWTKELDGDGLPNEIWCECPSCSEKIDERKKTWMLAHGDWFSIKGAEDEKRYRVDDSVENRSFQISGLYSPYGFRGWRDIVRDWFEYQRTKDINLLQVFINETLGEPFTLEGQELSYHHLETRKEGYGTGYWFDVPNGGLVLTAGADVQADRIECAVIAWGMFDECWHVDYVVFPGDTSDMGDNTGMTADGQPSVWLLFDQYLLKRFRHQSGVDMPIEVAMVDTGYNGEQVHIFCRNRENRRVFPVKGKNGWGYGFWQVNRKRHQKYGTFDYTAYTDELKAKVYSLLSIDTVGAGYVHFPNQDVYGEKWFKGLVCESRKTKMVSGQKKLYWETPAGARNEPLDTFNYAYVARNAYPVNIEERARKVGIQISQVIAAGMVAPVKKRKRGSFGGL
jgi:phage terminase large subunit GpA-like protein